MGSKKISKGWKISEKQQSDIEWLLVKLRFLCPMKERVSSAITAPPNPVEYVDSTGVIWLVYRHHIFASDLQLWIHSEEYKTIQFRQRGRLIEESHDFSSLTDPALLDAIRKAEMHLQQIINKIAI